MPGLEVAPLCKGSGGMALLASGEAVCALIEETLGSIEVGSADMAFPGSMSLVFWHKRSLTLVPGPSHLLLVAYVEPFICKLALICQWQAWGRKSSSQ